MRENFLQTKTLYNRIRRFIFHAQLGRFLVVGLGAFLVNVVLLYLLHGVLGLPILIAQLLGAEGTIIFSFLVHHNWTYRSYGHKSLALRFLEFNGSALGGSLISTLSVLAATQLLHVHYLIGLSAGAVLALSWNYALNLYFVWSKQIPKQPIYEENQ